MDVRASQHAVRSVAHVTRRIRTSVVHDTLRIVADPWSPQILFMVWQGQHRFDQLVEALGVSRSTLTQRLTQLLQEGCLLREVREGRHARYVLTEKGSDLISVVLLNRQWNKRWGLPNRLCADHEPVHVCGAPLKVVPMCARCRTEIRARDVKVLDTGFRARTPTLPPMPTYRRARQHLVGRESGNERPMTGEDLAGDRWISLILAVSFMGLRRHTDIGQAIGIAPNILAQRLSLLTANGVLVRVRYQEAPERYEYFLTPKGLDRYGFVLALMGWAQRWIPVRHPPEWRMLHAHCHEWLEVELVCERCEAQVCAHEVSLQPRERGPRRV